MYRLISGEPVECCAADACLDRLDELCESERQDLVKAGLLTDTGAG